MPVTLVPNPATALCWARDVLQPGFHSRFSTLAHCVLPTVISVLVKAIKKKRGMRKREPKLMKPFTDPPDLPLADLPEDATSNSKQPNIVIEYLSLGHLEHNFSQSYANWKRHLCRRPRPPRPPRSRFI
jgi:hypothetical protein